MIKKESVILVLAPHTDDGEFGCGASLSRWIEEGKAVYYVAFSSAEKSVPPGLPKDILKREVVKATKVLGVSPKNLILLNYPVREFPTYRQDILEDMIKLGNNLKPNMILLPSTSDTHQDHQTVSNEGFRAFKKITILGYEMPHNNLTFTTNMFVSLNDCHLNKKIEALECYDSQKSRNCASADFIRSLATIRGTQVGIKYAEAFEVIRWVM